MTPGSLEHVWVQARYVASRRVDYRVERSDEVFPGDTIRLVPGPGKPVPIELYQPMDVIATAAEFGLVSLTLAEHGELVNEVLYGVSAPTHTTVIYDKGWPVLVRR